MLKSVAQRHAQSVPQSKEDESDIVQRSIVKAFEKLAQFEGETSGQWRAWLIAIVRNQAKDVRRFWGQDRRACSAEDGGSHAIRHLADKSQPTPEATLEGDEDRQRLDAAIATLSMADQQLVRWRGMQFLTTREVAARLKITESVATAVRRGHVGTPRRLAAK